MDRNDMEMISRIKEAAGYQRKAIRALFHERTIRHLDVISGEIRSMLKEAVSDIVLDCVKKHSDADNGTEEKKEASNGSKTRKVEIV